VTYLAAWAQRLPLARLEATIRHLAGLAQLGRLDRVGLDRLGLLRRLWAERVRDRL